MLTGDLYTVRSGLTAIGDSGVKSHWLQWFNTKKNKTREASDLTPFRWIKAPHHHHHHLISRLTRQRFC
jgi:hypothetical protein